MTESKKIVIDIEATGNKSINDASMSLKQLKAELKSAQSAALNGDGKAAKRVAELKDKMDDLKDTTKSLQGSGVEKVTSSFGLLGEGLRNFDFDKIKTGFKGIGTAMSAIPVFLIAEGVSYLIENWKELSEGNGILAKSLQGITWVFEKLGEEINALTDTLGLTNTALEKQGEAIKSNAEKATEALSVQNAEFDRQIRVAKASGESTIEIEKKKQQAIIDTNLLIAKQEQAFIGAAIRGGEAVDKQHYERLNGALEAIRNAKVSEFEINKEGEKKNKDEYLKNLDAKKKADDEARHAKYKKDQELIMQALEDEEYLKAQDELDKKKAMEDADALAQYQADKLNYSAQLQEEISANKKISDEQERQRKLQQADEDIAIARNVAQSVQSLSDTVFAIKMAKVKKGSVEEEKLARRQFNINKALQLTLAGIDAAKAITTSLASAPLFVGTVPNPAGIAGLAAAITSSAAAIATIATKQFQPNGGGDTSAPTVNLGSVGGGESPTTSAPTTQVQPFTRLDEQGRNQSIPMVKAYMVESEVTESQKRVGRLEGQASFG